MRYLVTINLFWNLTKTRILIDKLKIPALFLLKES